MSEGLTKEAIDRICDFTRDYKTIDAIKALRSVWPFGLKEAVDFLKQYRDDVAGLRNRLLQMADIKEGMVFENYFLKVEVKNPGDSFRSTNDFLMNVLFNTCPNQSKSFVERRTIFLDIAERFFAEASFEEMNELCAKLMDRIARK